MTNFRTLVRRAARRDLNKTEKPKRLVDIASDCGISRQHLYNLMNGTHVASGWVEARIAAGLRLSLDTVKRALRASREEAEVLK